MIVIGADTHKRSHTVAAVDAATGRLLDEQTIAARRRSFDALLIWARGHGGERVWAIEDCRHVSGALERFLLARGEAVVRVAPKLTANARSSARELGKSDVIDAVAIARAALHEGLRSEGPNPLKSRAYAKDFREVKSLGSLSSTRRTEDQTNAAIFWQTQPLGIYGGVMRSLSARFGLTTADNARLFAMVSLASADGAIGCWNDKYYWNFWRPIDAIRLAATDGNRATKADPSWKALFDPATVTTPPLATPNFPDHPSGHGCVSSAVLNTMREFFGTDKIEFDAVSTRFPGTPAQTRHFDRFSHALKEIIDARVWGGIHFRTADTQGAVIGKKVARWERKHFFRPVG